ncbi:KH domain-containing protein [Pallidibacillus pasinlerensis]|uniref:RNA-binding protein KhpA n=1 Tax=Pallidibacillus pasinlerensis TaxID=2703818 RepID=A0ABX0A0Z7_9BACI|nr:KH domain-containing protein [Pallidibacillus pasinlerensis]NCU16254.1 KH domain-containing protein [Pallidibacillus pasinlerensis]
MKNLIESLVKPLVDYPEEVTIEAVEEDNRIIYKLTVHKDDIGKVIGKRGRVAKAIRTVVYAYAHTTENKKVFLEITE